ncbi:MAG: hypothetical protein NTY98_13240 [Verrucomicrobia bacterium]|nr:hypothetical protein [Verrucomicrobiota bacterium]
MNKEYGLFAALLLAPLFSLCAAEHSVGPGGFKTIAAGVAALKPGDTLTIMPGEYRETVSATLVGAEKAPITIRAWRRGSVLLRGDLGLKDFKPAPGLQDVFVTKMRHRVESVFERSTFRTLEPKMSAGEVGLSLMSYYHDEKNNLLYVHTSDSLPPECHAMGASITNANGLLLAGSKHVIIDGLSFTGFSHRDYDPQQGSRTRWGLMLKDCESCIVRRCTAYLNSGGIHLLGKGRDCVVEDCTAFGNWSRHVDIGNNIVGWGVAGTTFQRNRVEGCMPDEGTSRNDITFYSGGDHCMMLDNVAINASVMIKGDLKDAVQRGNVCIGRKFYRPPGAENIELPIGATPADAARFADVLNHDYRTGDVFFVSPGGDDANPGTKAKPWKTLARATKASSTVYLMAGEYEETLVPGAKADFRRHGHDRVALKDVIIIAASGVRLHGLQVREKVTVSGSEDLQIDFCTLASLSIRKSPRLVLAHNWIKGPLTVDESRGGSLISNIIAERKMDAESQVELWEHSNVAVAAVNEILSDDSPLIGRGLHASTIGPFLRLSRTRPLPISRAAVHDVTTTTATLEWTTPTQAAATALEWGGTKIETPRGSQHSVSLNGLQPGTAYEFRITSRRKDEQRVFAMHQPQADKTQAVFETQTVTTAVEPRTVRALHVPGDFKTISDAADAARAGDTVLIHAGVYEETVRIRSSGDAGAPITFAAAPGEVVWMDGSGRFRANAFILPQKHHIILDGLRFRHFRFAPELGPVIHITGGSHHIIRRCFHDGRELEGYVGTFIGAMNARELLVENSVFINGMGEAIGASNCPDLTVRHCVFYNNFIRAMTAHMEEPDVLVYFHHNLVCDSIPTKVNNALLRIWHADALRSDHNVFFTRIPGDQRRFVETAHIHGQKVGHEDPATYRGENLLLSDMQTQFRQELNTRTGNPGILATPRLVPRNDNDEREWRTVELHRDGNSHARLDFKDFVPATYNTLSKASDGKPVGLEPEALH